MTLATSQHSAEAAFHAALVRRDQLGPASVTDTWLADLCAGDVELCNEVKSLLSHFDKAGTQAEDKGFLNPEELHGSRAAALQKDAQLKDWGGTEVGQRIGDFVIIGQLGAGGMGIVYVAEQQRPRRTVALKVIRRSVVTPAMVVRFEREAELLGRLSHPGIAQIFAAGVADVNTTASGTIRVPYIAMEQVHGLHILEHVRLHRMTPRQIVGLAVQTCDAIQHAHQRGVIHRDLKPANLLVTLDGLSHRVKVLDFGVARAVGSRASEESLTRLTGQGHLVGTPAYMSPEQIAGKDAEVGAGADVYAIGAILFQLLTDRLAIDLRDCPLPEIARRVVEEVPSKLRTIDRRLRGDLETIVATALEKNVADRYDSAAALCEDLQSYLDGRPIAAKRDAWTEPYLKIAVRNRAMIACVAIVAALFFLLGWFGHAMTGRSHVP